MRLRGTAAVVAALTLLALGGCGTGSPGATADAPATTAGNNRPACDAFVTWATDDLTDESDPAAAQYTELLSDPEKFPVAQRVAIRQTYFTEMEKDIRALATTATDPPLAAALQTFADGWAERAAVTSPDGPDSIQPDRRPIAALCPGMNDRIEDVLRARED